MAISQNIGTTITALLPALFATVAPPGSTNIPLTIGAITFGITVIAALAALSARETYRVSIDDLGNPKAVPMAAGRLRSAARGSGERCGHSPDLTGMNEGNAAAIDVFAAAGLHALFNCLFELCARERDHHEVKG